MRWLHVSDLHFGNDINAAVNMRNSLKKLAPRVGHIDCLFITGDLRYGKACGQSYPETVVEYIGEWQKAFGVPKKTRLLSRETTT